MGRTERTEQLAHYDVSRNELMQLFRCSRSTTYRLERMGYIPRPVKVGPGLRRWSREEILALQAKLAADRGAGSQP